MSNWRGAHNRDFGGLIDARPRDVIRARSEADIVSALRQARDTGRPLTVQGAGHSCHGQSLSHGGLLLVNRDGAEPAVLTGDLVEASGRARWREVERVLNRAGRTVPVLADYLSLTVGGTLSVGGYGVESVQRGVQVDHVTRLRLVTPDGRARWCSRDEHSELFQFALAGLGQVGVIERAVLATAPYCRYTTLFIYRHRSLAELIDSLAWMAEPGATLPSFFKAQDTNRRVISVYGVHSATWSEARQATPPAGAPAAPARRLICRHYRRWRDRAVSIWLARYVGHYRLWSDYLLDHQGLGGLATMLDREGRDNLFAGCLKCIYIVAIRRVPRTLSVPLEASDVIAGPMAFGVGMYAMIPPRRPDLVAAVRAAAACCLAEAIDRGGRPYLYGWHELSEAQRRHTYGPSYDRLTALKKELDPDGVFQPHQFGLSD